MPKIRSISISTVTRERPDGGASRFFPSDLYDPGSLEIGFHCRKDPEDTIVALLERKLECKCFAVALEQPKPRLLDLWRRIRWGHLWVVTVKFTGEIKNPGGLA